MSTTPRMRARMGKFAERFIPGLEDRAFNRARNAAEPTSRAPRGGYRPVSHVERDPHIVVVPQEGPQFESWQPGTRNFYFEAFQTARELFGDDAVSVLDVSKGERPESWQRRLQDHLLDRKATHIVTHIEHDPGNPEQWTWDIAWNQLASRWDGALLGVMFDSAFPLITMKARRIARMSPNFVAVDICARADSVMVPGRIEVGPVTMPVSRMSSELVRDRIQEIEPTHDVSFIGVMYPYRMELVDRLRADGVDIAVNPHRQDFAEDPLSSRRLQPSWLDYMAGLASSRMTINFSRFSADDVEQLKTRVIEATLAGTFLLTDDRNSTRLFFDPEVEFGCFAGIESLPDVINHWKSRSNDVELGRRQAQTKAREIGATDFWARISNGLNRRGLPRVESDSAGKVGGDSTQPQR